MFQRITGAYRSAFAGLPREVWILAGAMLVNRSGTMVLPFMSLYLTRVLGFSTLDAGRVLGLYGLGAVAGAYAGGWLSDRVGSLRVQQASLVGTGVGFLILAQLEGKLALSIAVPLVSFVAEWFRPALFAATTQAAAPEVRTRSLALLRLAVNLGMSIGPAVGGLLAAHHYRLLFVGDALTCWAAAAMLWFTLGGKRSSPSRESRPLEATQASPWRDAPFLVFMVLMVALGTMFFQIMATLPLYLRAHYHMSEATIGAVLAINAFTIALVEMVLLRSIEHRNHLLVAGTGGLLVGLGFALLPFGQSVAFAILTVLVWTGGEMLSLPMTNSLATMRAPAASAGRYIGLYTMAFSVAFVAAPLIGTAVFERLGPEVLWYSVGVTGVLVWLGFIALARNQSQGWSRQPSSVS